MNRGVGDYFMSVGGLKVEGINLWIGSLISVLFPLHFKLLIWWLVLRASLIFCLFSTLVLIAFGFRKDSRWQTWLLCPQRLLMSPGLPLLCLWHKVTVLKRFAVSGSTKLYPLEWAPFQTARSAVHRAFIWGTNLTHIPFVCMCVHRAICVSLQAPSPHQLVPRGCS